ncbi:MAG: prepilin-type N-terminal cleavage/methylation domain-containing protein [Candidatus Liptonbacteria bacterium]
MKHLPRRGFTMIEILIVIAIIAVMAGVMIYALDPTRQLAKGRNAQRRSNIMTLVNAIGQNMADNRGSFNCAAGIVPATSTVLGSGGGQYNIHDCLVPAYLPSLPYDPTAPSSSFVSSSSYNTQYTILRNASTGRITVGAPFAEIGESISETR